MTTTPAKGLTQPVVGGDNNTWGALLNTNLSLIDSSLGGTLILSISGNVTLNTTQTQNSGYKFTGSLSGDATITWPTFRGIAVVRNATTGGFSLVCGIAGTTVTIPNGESVSIWSDGTDFIRLAREGGGSQPLANPYCLQAWGNGFANDGVTDDTTAWNNIMAAASALGGRAIVQLPNNNALGGMSFHSKPNALPAGVLVQGVGAGATILRRHYTPSDPYEIFIEMAHNGGSLLNGVYLNADSGTSGGVALGLVGSPTISGDFSRFSDIIIDGLFGGIGTWLNGIYLDGLTKHGSGVAPGMRDFHFVGGLLIAQCTQYHMELYSVKGSYFTDLVCIPQRVDGAFIHIDGNIPNGVTNDQLWISGPQVADNLWVDNAINLRVDYCGGGGSAPYSGTITLGNNTTDCLITCSGNGGGTPVITDTGTRNRIMIADQITCSTTLVLKGNPAVSLNGINFLGEYAIGSTLPAPSSPLTGYFAAASDATVGKFPLIWCNGSHWLYSDGTVAL